MKTQKIILLFTFCFLFLFTEIVIAQKEYQPIVKKSIFFGKSKAMRDVKIILPGPELEMKEVEVNPLPDYAYDRSQITQNRLIPENVQDHFGSVRAKGPGLNFEGVENVNGTWPADPNGDVGLNHYVQSVNNATAIWDKSGNLLYGPIDNESIFNAFPGPWHLLFWSDPVFVYDALADRWVFSSMSLHLEGPYYEMIAVSVTSDPLGEYYCYAYEFGHLNDYPKMSVWPNGYYLTYNIFDYNGDWFFLHSLISAVDREAMLAGDSSATMVQFELEPPAANVTRMSPLTADLNGTLMPDNPECFVVVPEYKMQGFPWETNLDFYSMQPNWITPENSTFDSINQINVEGIFPTFWETNAPQPGNFHDVEPINFYLMYPLTYRNFDDYEVMVGCHTLYDGEQHYIRWYEFRKYFDMDWFIYQSGNYMPDSASRYVPSISMNGKGDMAMVFTKSSLEIYPSMCMTGRKAGDSLGMMTISELEIWKGLNYVNNYSSSDNRNRWGDYASMMVDPVNDTTFWFTSMYPLAHVSRGNWSTRIVAMDLSEATNAPSAGAGPDTTICGYESFLTQGEATNYSSLIWETNGDGVFSNPRKLHASYLRGFGDLENGQVTLHLSVTGYEPEMSAADSMILYLNNLPQVEAGPEDTICVNQSYTCQGEVSFSNSYYWTTTGGGSFNDSTLLDAIYTPALSDTAYDWLILTLHAEPMYPCTQGDDDHVLLHIWSCLGVDEVSDGINLEIYPNPSSGLVTVQADRLATDNTGLQVLNSRGQLIFSGSFPCPTGKLKKQFDFGKLPKGAYYVQVLNRKKTSIVKLIIH